MEMKKSVLSCRATCDRLWENPAEVARQNSEKKGKKKVFLVKMPL
jgi:hypothetical protein